MTRFEKRGPNKSRPGIGKANHFSTCERRLWGIQEGICMTGEKKTCSLLKNGAHRTGSGGKGSNPMVGKHTLSSEYRGGKETEGGIAKSKPIKPIRRR